MKKMCSWICVTSLLFAAQLAFAKTLELRIPPPESKNDPRHAYYRDLLKMALEKTGQKNEKIQLTNAPFQMQQDRALELLKSEDVIDVFWSMTSKDRVKQLRIVPIPLLKGLLGHRVFIINKEDENKFAAVQTDADLKKLVAGQGHDWPDTEILKANGVSVSTSPSYDALFDMLQKRRFDYFPRGVNEPWSEVQIHKDQNLIVEKNLLIYYPTDVFFFVNKKNAKLATRLEKGLRIAIRDGSFDKLFLAENKEVFELANIKSRKIFRFKNPLLPNDTPIHDKELWLDISKLAK